MFFSNLGGSLKARTTALKLFFLSSPPINRLMVKKGGVVLPSFLRTEPEVKFELKLKPGICAEGVYLVLAQTGAVGKGLATPQADGRLRSTVSHVVGKQVGQCKALGLCECADAFHKTLAAIRAPTVGLLTSV